MDNFENINQKWCYQLIRQFAFVVCLVFLTELVLFIYFYNTDNLNMTPLLYAVKYLIIPTVVNAAAVCMGFYINNSSRFTDVNKTYGTSIMAFVICVCVQCSHYMFAPVLCSTSVAIFVTCLFGNEKLTRLIGILSACSIAATYLIARFDPLEYNELEIWVIIALFIILYTYLLTKLIIAKEQEGVSLLIHNRKEQESMLYELQHDYLTGLYSRRLFFDTLEYVSENRKKFCICILDIDDFKLVNDTYGHVIGDKVLAYMGEVLTSVSTDEIFVSRIGGEEFAFIFIETEPQEAERTVEALRMEIEKHTFYVDRNVRSIQITISAGLAQCQDGKSYHNIFEYADQALYQSKESGKNKLVWYTESV